MAAISRIQVANFLTEGFTTGKEWSPLYRGETFRLFGQPTAMQIDNGGGKTSLTEACLYTLTRDRRLKPRVEDRVAPIDRGWTHIRIEFIEKPHDEEILQGDLITLDPVDIPGIPYVVGMCWSRTKDPYFYAYQGSLDDAPCYMQEQKCLSLVTNDSFRKSVERMPGAKWNRWRSQADWLEEIKQFTNIEVLKQNVEFQLEGAGDYSAMINKVKQEPGESYDAAFFRQFVAPELLKHAMGVEGDPDEHGFEDTILRTLKPAADALLDINRRQRELDDTTQALQKFEPVLEKAGEVITANADYDKELNDLAQNAAIVHSLAVAAPLPGMPVVPAETQWASDKRVMAALAHMVIDTRHGVMISDEGLFRLSGVPTGEINRRATTGAGIVVGSEVIDIKYHLKISGKDSHPTEGAEGDLQHIDNKHHLKKDGRGGRRYGAKFYDLDQALSIVAASVNLAGATTSGLDDTLTRAFGIAADDIDTNPYRARLRTLASDLKVHKARLAKAKSDSAHFQGEYECLIAQSREAEENQIAYEGFSARARQGEFPVQYWESPVDAREWAAGAAKEAETERTEHIRLSSERQAGFELWQTLSETHGLTPLAEALATLVQHYTDATRTAEETRRDLEQASASLREKRVEYVRESGKLTAAEKRLNKLDELAASMPAFREIFGNADLESLNPQGERESLQGARSKNESLLENAAAKRQELADLQPKVRAFLELFGNVPPESLNPSKALQDHLQAIVIEDGMVTEHQPFLEGLAYFREQHPGSTPEEWLAKASDQRQALNRERVGNDDKLGDLNGELEDLATFGASDDRVYAKALKLLGENGIVFDRLHDLASRTVTGDRLKECLTLFSAALSAPVIESINVAGEAARLLEEAKLTVPIFLKSALERFLHDGKIHQSGEIAHALWIGRHTRQVAILLNPSLIEQEKIRIREQIQALTRRNETIAGLLAEISEESVAVKTAINAKEAIRRGTERIYAEAWDRRDALQGKTAEFERRASPEAQEAISSRKRFLKAGGEAQYGKLIEEVIPELENKRAQIDSRLSELAKQTTEQALRALHSAKDFQREGGEAALAKARAEAEELNQVVKSLRSTVSELDGRVNGELADGANNATTALNQINATYALEKRDLEAVIKFEQDGLVEFMKGSPDRMQELDAAIKTAQARLQGIDFNRAARYIQSTRTDERSISDLIAEAQGKRDEAGKADEEAGKEITRIEGDMAFITPFMEAMHETVAAILAQHAKVSMFSEDIRHLIQTSSISDPEILRYAETIRIACLGEIPGIDQGIRAAMLNLKQCVSDLEINTGNLQRLDDARKRHSREYIHRRDEFCDRARRGEIKGLNQLEISTIAEAKTIEELQRIQETRDKIEAQISEFESNLGKIREAMEANKKASVNSLASFARQATLSLDIMDRVMRNTPKARFHVEAPVADEKQIEKIIEGLLGQIEEKERLVRERGVALLNEDIERKAADYKQLIHDTIYRQIFSTRDQNENPVMPRVYFTHASIRGMEKVPFTDRGLSTGQRTALAMMWMIKQAEFAIARAAALYSTRKEQKAAIKGAQRIMFFDGLFSNLSNEDYINDAFQGLRGVGENFQLIGLIHNPYYVNNKDIFPVHLVGKKKVANKGHPERERVFVSVEPWQDDNGMILYTSAYKHKAQSAAEEVFDV